jgi:hypothetical protein
MWACMTGFASRECERVFLKTLVTGLKAISNIIILVEMVCTEQLGQNFIIFAQKRYEEMIQLLSTCPYSFCGSWGVFVLQQFRTRYCGHTLSRLAEIRHNMTKQCGFPTIRRKDLKSWNTMNTIQVILAQ